MQSVQGTAAMAVRRNHQADAQQIPEAIPEVTTVFPVMVQAFNDFKDSIAIFDREWRYVYVNDQAVRTLRHPRQELLGQVLWAKHPRVLGTEFEAIYRRAMTDQRPRHVIQHYEPRDSWYRTSVYPSPQGLLVHIRDVTEERHAHEMNDRLLKSLESRLGQAAERRRAL